MKRLYLWDFKYKQSQTLRVFSAIINKGKGFALDDIQHAIESTELPSLGRENPCSHKGVEDGIGVGVLRPFYKCDLDYRVWSDLMAVPVNHLPCPSLLDDGVRHL